MFKQGDLVYIYKKPDRWLCGAGAQKEEAFKTREKGIIDRHKIHEGQNMCVSFLMVSI